MAHEPQIDLDEFWKANPATIRTFVSNRPDYEQLASEVAYILRKRLTAAGIEFASISSRAKTLNSFLEKIQRKKYADPFKEITDFAGARVVCLYGSDVAEVSEIITSEFSISETVDKSSQLGVNEFGYVAMHFIAGIGTGTSGARYDEMRGKLCEIQVRTVLQDAWAIIQHHMVYKRENEVPNVLKKKLAGLAAVLSNADDTFDAIRTERSAYIAAMQAELIAGQEFLDNEINYDSIKVYREKKGLPTDDPLEEFRRIPIIIEACREAGIRTLRQLDAVVDKKATIVARLQEKLLSRNMGPRTMHYYEMGFKNGNEILVSLMLEFTGLVANKVVGGLNAIKQVLAD